MEISAYDLTREYKNARLKYPAILKAEETFHLPHFLLYAIGSRETNLTNEVGDFGHGHGMFQLDDRWHEIPVGFDQNVTAQADYAAKMVAHLISLYPGNLKAAVAAYNCGSGNVAAGIRDFGNPDAYTTHADYGADVLGRMMYLQQHYSRDIVPTPVPHPKPVKGTVYVVKQGDNLTTIGQKFHVSWQRIYRANKRVIGNNPNLIFPGEKLTIPRKFF